MKLTQHTILYWLFFIFIVSLPVNSLYETIAHLQGTLPWNKTFPLTPVYLKIFKDVFLVGGILLIVMMGGGRYVKKDLVPYYCFIAFVLVFSFFSINAENSFAVLLGVRSYFVVFFIILGFYFYDFEIMRVYPLLRFILYVELVVQVLQFFYAPTFYGKPFHGYSLFNPGTFLIPSTMASFAIVVHHYAVKKDDALTISLALFSVFLAKSATAWVVMILYYVIVLAKRKRLGNDVVIAGIFIAGLFIFFNLDRITGRDSIMNNLITRWGIFTDSLASPLGKGFGLGSSASVLSQVKQAIIADSTISSLIINFGWMGLAIYLLFVLGSLQVFEFNDLLLLAFVGFSFTMIVFEMTPFIQFFFFEWGRRLRMKKVQQQLSLISPA